MNGRVVILGLGSNIGDRLRHLQNAHRALDRAPNSVEATSRIFETEPVGPPQPHYLNAALRENLRIVMGDSVAIIRVPVDGRWHSLRVSLPRVQPDSVVLLSDGYAVEPGRAQFTVALEVGVLSTSPHAVIGPSVVASGFDRTDSGRLVSKTRNTRLVFPVPTSSTPIIEMTLLMRLFKPVDSETWSMATRSYHNLLGDSGVARALTQAQPIPLTLADSIVPFYLD